jgi:GAF domain-containing protein
MATEQARSVLMDRRGTMYDPWIVDTFLGIVDDLQKEERDSATAASDDSKHKTIAAEQFGAILTTRREDRQLRTLRTQLARPMPFDDAARLVFEYLQPALGDVTFAVYATLPETTNLVSLATRGPAMSLIDRQSTAIGDRIVGWAYANLQHVVNSEAALELGPAALELTPPVTHALVVPVIDESRCLAVLGVYGPAPFSQEHQRLVESTASLLAETRSITLQSHVAI